MLFFLFIEKMNPAERLVAVCIAAFYTIKNKYRTRI
jgi:hypothetical protein